MGWTCLAALGVIAHWNLKNARGDRRNATKLGTATAVVVTITWLLWSHSPLDVLARSLGAGLVGGLGAWVFYVGVEPGVRRAWPHLLISSTRLLDGRWRDPLVGRSLLAGVLGAAFLIAPWSLAVPRLFGVSWAGPAANVGEEYLLMGARPFVGTLLFGLPWGLVIAGLVMSVFVVVRLAIRRADATWFVVALIFVGWMYFNVRVQRPEGIDAFWALGVSAFLVTGSGWVLWKHGALALATSLAAHTLFLSTPWTMDVPRWYAWHQWLGAATVVGLAVWGFRNVLGKQSAFPAGALDR
jgi:hypothetical protein